MSEAIDIKDVFDELKSLRKDVEYIKEHMIDPDTIMTNEEYNIHEKGINEFKRGKTASLSKVKKELGI